jgi:hypothetical protein
MKVLVAAVLDIVDELGSGGVVVVVVARWATGEIAARGRESERMSECESEMRCLRKRM